MKAYRYYYEYTFCSVDNKIALNTYWYCCVSRYYAPLS